MGLLELGSDFAGVADLTPTLAFSSGRKALLEAICDRWLSPEGGLWYDPEHGAGLLLLTNSTNPNTRSLAGKLEAQALLDERVAACSVTVDWLPAEQRLIVTGTITPATGLAFDMTLAVSSLTGRLLVQTELL